MRVQVTITLEVADAVELGKRAEEQGITISHLLQKLLHEYLEK
jgi:hypothetical protein